LFTQKSRLITELEIKGIDSRMLLCWAHSHGNMIGSVTGLCLCKMGVCKLTCCDADVVDIHNVGN
jgi:hypothetical protein